MTSKPRLKVVLCWHMHQPDYRDPATGEYQLPWTYLHGIKDYVDMAAHLEAVPEARAVINFAPILLEQIEDYHAQIRDYLAGGPPLRDPWLAALVAPEFPQAANRRVRLAKDFLRANKERLINRYSDYRRLAAIAAPLNEDQQIFDYLSDQYLADLAVWHHLAWLGETVRRENQHVRQLLEKGMRYTPAERRELLAHIGELLGSLISRYRRLAERGQIELSMTPYAHPILPLLLEIESVHEAMPGAALPRQRTYPGGEARARWHLEKGIEIFRRCFGFSPLGCWPSEGSVSEAALRLLDKFGFRWAASGESVLRNSLKLSNMQKGDGLHHSYRLRNSTIACFFRSDELSDAIGFTYSGWHADDAVSNLLHKLETIARDCRPDSVVSVILDGENAWEHYPENGCYFLSGLYRRLASHPDLELTTFSRCLEEGVEVKELPRLVAGSWVYGTFSTWIGDRDKNRGWEMLIEAKQAFDAAVSSGRLSDDRRALAERQLAICEGSDWFWWFGDYNPAEAVSDFETMFRLNLTRLYELLQAPPPAYLQESFTHGGGEPAKGGTMRAGQAVE